MIEQAKRGETDYCSVFEQRRRQDGGKKSFESFIIIMIVDSQCSCIYSCKACTHRTLSVHNSEQHVADMVERRKDKDGGQRSTVTRKEEGKTEFVLLNDLIYIFYKLSEDNILFYCTTTALLRLDKGNKTQCTVNILWWEKPKTSCPNRTTSFFTHIIILSRF